MNYLKRISEGKIFIISFISLATITTIILGNYNINNNYINKEIEE